MSSSPPVAACVTPSAARAVRPGGRATRAAEDASFRPERIVDAQRHFGELTEYFAHVLACAVPELIARYEMVAPRSSHASFFLRHLAPFDTPIWRAEIERRTVAYDYDEPLSALPLQESHELVTEAIAPLLANIAHSVAQLATPAPAPPVVAASAPAIEPRSAAQPSEAPVVPASAPPADVAGAQAAEMHVAREEARTPLLADARTPPHQAKAVAAPRALSPLAAQPRERAEVAAPPVENYAFTPWKRGSGSMSAVLEEWQVSSR